VKLPSHPHRELGDRSRSPLFSAKCRNREPSLCQLRMIARRRRAFAEAIKSPPMNFYPPGFIAFRKCSKLWPSGSTSTSIGGASRNDLICAAALHTTAPPFRSSLPRQLACDQPRQADGAPAASAGTSRLALGARAPQSDLRVLRLFGPARGANWYRWEPRSHSKSITSPSLACRIRFSWRLLEA
jgi:hypothetical protein